MFIDNTLKNWKVKKGFVMKDGALSPKIESIDFSVGSQWHLDQFFNRL